MKRVIVLLTSALVFVSIFRVMQTKIEEQQSADPNAVRRNMAVEILGNSAIAAIGATIAAGGVLVILNVNKLKHID